MKENLSTNILSCAIILVYYFGIRSKSVLAYGWHTVGIRSKSVLAYGWHTVQIRSGIRLAYGWHTSTTLLLRLGIRSNSCLAYGRHTAGIRWHTASVCFGIRSGSAAPRQEFLQLAEVSKVCGLAVYLWFHKDISDCNIQN